MFGLVKASRLRKAEKDDHVVAVKTNALRPRGRPIANLETESETWEKLYFAQFRDTNNLRAVAESRLVAVLLLRDRFGHLVSDNTKLVNKNLELSKMFGIASEQQQLWTNAANEFESERDIALRDAARYASERDNVSKAYNQLSAHVAEIEGILNEGQPAIETAIIRPSSTNRLRWRVNDDDGKALCQSSTGYATANDAGMAFAPRRLPDQP